MTRKAKLISTGEIIEVHVDMDYHGNTTWVDATTNTEYYRPELELLLEEETMAPVKPSLSQFTDEELKEELRRRDKERHSKFPSNIRCRDCKYCVDGFTFRHQVLKTTICQMKPKPTQGPDRYYSTVCSHRACDKYKPKENK